MPKFTIGDAPKAQFTIGNAPPASAPPSMGQNFQSAFDELATPPTFDIHHPFSTGAADFGAGVFGLLTPVFHPNKSLDSATKLALGSTADKMSVIRPMIDAFKKDPAGQGTALLPQILPALFGDEASGVARSVGGIVERGGLDLGNAAMGARGARDFQYNLNPARGAYNSGALPSLSKHGTSMSLGEKLPVLGEDISNTVKAGAPVPLERIASSIDNPLADASAVAQGPGVGGLTDRHIEAVRASMASKAPLAQRPIYGPEAGTPFTAEEAAAEMRKVPRHLLPAPMEDVPLHSAPDVEGGLSKPITLHQPDRPLRLGLPSPSGEVPMAPGMQEEFPQRLASGTSSVRLNPPIGSHSGMGPGEYIGEVPGTRGGSGAPQGVLRRPMQFPQSNAPSGLADLRHPFATAPDLWRTIQNLDEKTKFRQNVTPEIENVNELQKGIRHNLRGNLEEASPGLNGKSGRYADMKAAQNVLDRTMHTDTGLNKLFQVPMYPIETTLGRGMYEAGRGIQAASPFAGVAARSAPLSSLMLGLRKKEKQ